MNIKQLRLNNFKIFKSAEINFRPLTLLTGTNSSGKSTILNALTTVLQTQSPYTFPFQIAPNGKGCSLGTYRDIANGKSTRTAFSIGLSLQLGEKLVSIEGRYRYSTMGNQILPDRIVYTDEEEGFDLVWQGQEKGYKAIVRAKVFNRMQTFEPMIAFKESLSSLVNSVDDKLKKRKNSKVFGELFKPQGGKWFALKSRIPSDVLDELRKQPAGGYILQSLTLVMERLVSSCTYIGPVRAYPSRFYETEVLSHAMDSIGKSTIPLLYEWKKHFPNKFREVIKLIQTLELATKVEARSSLDEILKVDVQPFRHSEQVGLTDVGFGISQVLPILVADVALPTGGTLMVNQPEVHLHPSSQALLGNYLVPRLKIRNYILETHSEYLINRLRVLAVEGKLDVDNVSIVFIDAPDGTARNPVIHNIRIGKDGSLIDAPKSFFETYYLDTFNLAMGGFTEDE